MQTEQFLAAHKKEQWALEDLAALYYLHARIKGVADEWKVRVVFIDEVQDYSYLQLAALKAGLETDMFTMVGDLAQGIHSYRALDSWEPVLELFPRATYATLQKSYRTTIEIMHVANQILAQMNEDLPLVEPVVRHGPEPVIMRSKEAKVAPIKKAYEKIRANGHKAVALICKTTDDAAKLLALLDAKLPVQLLTEDAQIDQDKLLIVPCHLAKGLEFDAVIAVIVDEPYYDTPTDRKLLYVALTRAMHELYLIGPMKKAFLL
jgi:DNA helicase II / ATP-dependent DNA helicase PcrA